MNGQSLRGVHQVMRFLVICFTPIQSQLSTASKSTAVIRKLRTTLLILNCKSIFTRGIIALYNAIKSFRIPFYYTLVMQTPFTNELRNRFRFEYYAAPMFAVGSVLHNCDYIINYISSVLGLDSLDLLLIGY